MPDAEQRFLNDLDKKLWNAADRLRGALDAAVYKHAVLGLIFLKYISDAFEDRQQELYKQVSRSRARLLPESRKLRLASRLRNCSQGRT
jgi:type I restriction-modification system DNA methylase subunit